MQYLATASPLDDLLDGGLECDAITLVFGEGGSGKTNLALQCAREVARRGQRIAYVDTEGVSSVRLRQVFAGHESAPHSAHDGPAHQPGSSHEIPSHPAPNGHPLSESRSAQGTAGMGIPQILADGAQDAPAQERLAMEEALPASATVALGPRANDTDFGAPTPEPSLEELMGRVLFFTPYTIEEQERLVQNATRVPDLGLIVVDSINMHYRLHIDAGGDAESDAGRSLYKQLHHLTGFARQNQVPVLVTGQVYGGEDTTQPFARRVMEHLVKALVRFEKRPDGSRRATVIKHRSIEEGRRADFRIGMTGLEPR